MAETGGARRWIGYGCLGCLGVLALAVVMAVAVIGIAAVQAGGEQLERRDVTHDVAGMAGMERGTAGTADAPGAGAAEAGGEAVTDALVAMPAGAGRVELDLRHGGFEIRPAREGEPLRVEASYDARHFTLTERVEESGPDGWVASVSFERHGSGLMAALRQMVGGTPPEVTVHLPRGVPYALELRTSEGGAEIDLGGLTLTSVEVRGDKCGMHLDVSRPLTAPVDRFVVDASFGGFALERLGNASPRRLEVDVSMGGGAVDLSGDWRADAEISLSSRMSGGQLELPDGVVIRGLEGHLGLEPDPEADVPVLTFVGSIDRDAWQID